MEIVFWSCVAFVFYVYAGYPVALLVLARLFGRPVERGSITPRVSFIVAARNEAPRIRAKIENTLSQDYPRDLLEIIVASDASNDGTNDIVAEYADRGVRLIVTPERRGKEFAQSEAIRAAGGEILIFSDAATQLGAEGVRRIVENFADPEVGCVSSADRVLDADGRPGGEGLYVRYEMLLRSLESRIGSVVGLSGSFFAARPNVCTPWAPDLPSDFGTLLNTLRLGMRGVSDASAVGSYRDLSDPSAEYRRKVRTVARGISSLGRHLHLLNPFRYGMAAYQLWTHKVCRWLVPFALIGLLISNAALVSLSGFYAAVATAQVIVYGFAVYGIRRAGNVTGCARILSFFVLANLSILNAWYDTARGRRVVMWQPSPRL